MVSIVSNDNSFAATKTDGSVITWGGFQRGGDSSLVSSQIDGTVDVVKIFPTSTAFAAIRTDGKIVSWGDWKEGEIMLKSVTRKYSSSDCNYRGFSKPTVTTPTPSFFADETTDNFDNTSGKILVSDADDDSFLFSIVDGVWNDNKSVMEGVYGTLSINTNTGEWTYDPNENIKAANGRASEAISVKHL